IVSLLIRSVAWHHAHVQKFLEFVLLFSFSRSQVASWTSAAPSTGGNGFIPLTDVPRTSRVWERNMRIQARSCFSEERMSVLLMGQTTAWFLKRAPVIR